MVAENKKLETSEEKNLENTFKTEMINQLSTYFSVGRPID